MKITSVTYRCLRTGSGYNNTAVEATAAVAERDDPKQVLEELRFWVDREVDQRLKMEKELSSLDSLRYRVEQLQVQADRLQKRVDGQNEIIRENQKLADLARENGLGGAALLLLKA